MITGLTLIAWGHVPGPGFGEALRAAQEAQRAGEDVQAIRTRLERFVPPPAPPTLSLRKPGETPAYHVNLVPEYEEDFLNLNAVCDHMNELMRVPTVVAGAIMPDACPSGQAKGTIPVGGVVATKNAIHPGMHSADICCSMAFSNIGRVDPDLVLDAAMQVTHFGPGGRGLHPWHPDDSLLQRFKDNRFLRPLMPDAINHFGTQGDGNHFFYVGELNGDTVIVTHHGSRGPGAKLYKAGMLVAEGYRKKLSPETAKHNAWIPADTDDGRAYWEALQTIRMWTKASHFAIHDAVIRSCPPSNGRKHGPFARFWNEHNFVFQRDDGLYYHAKGATPSFAGFAKDSSGLTLIPLNMAEPILITRPTDAKHGLGFAPHGAGRNFSRTGYLKSLAGQDLQAHLRKATRGIDARFYSGTPDLSELPGAYKNAASVRRQIEQFGLAEIVGEIMPYGCIMAGEIDWRKAQ